MDLPKIAEQFCCWCGARLGVRHMLMCELAGSECRGPVVTPRRYTPDEMPVWGRTTGGETPRERGYGGGDMDKNMWGRD